jgi:hypothetical protein
MAAGVLIIVALWVVVFGLPDRLCDELTRYTCSGGPFSLDAGAARLDGWDELVFTQAKAYRRKVVGPAAGEAAEVRVRFDPRAALRGELLIRGIEVRGGIIRPHSLFAQSWRAGTGGATDLRFSVPLRVRNCVVQGVTVPSVTCMVVGSGPVLAFENVVAIVTNAGFSGPVDGWVRCNLDEGTVTGLVHTAFEPLLLEPVFMEWGLSEVVSVLRQFEFTAAPPRVETVFNIGTNDGCMLALDSQARIQDGSYKGVAFMRADGDVHVRYGRGLLTVGLDPLVVVRRDGLVDGRLLVDIEAGTVTYDGSSSIQPVDLARAIGIFGNGELKPFAFGGALRVVSGGTVDYRGDGRSSRLDVKAAVDSLGYGEFSVRGVNGTMRMSGLTNRFESLAGQFLEGMLTGRGEVVLPASPDGRPAYNFNLRLEKAEFAKLAGMRKPAAAEEYRGRLDATLDIEGLMGEGQGRSVKGRGTIRIRDGQVFSLSLFGGLSAAMAKVIPGLDFVMRQSDAKADVVIGDGKVVAERIEIAGDVLSLIGRGECTFDGRLDFLIRVTLMKEHSLVGSLLRRLTSPISGLFEFHLVGTLDKPDWRLVNFSKELLERLGILDKAPEPAAQ